MSSLTISAAASANTKPAATPPSTKRRTGRVQAGAIDLANIAARQAAPLTLRELNQLYRDAHPDKDHAKTAMDKWIVEFGLGDVLAWNITREQLQAGASAMTDTFGFSVSSVNRNLSQIGSLYKWAAKQKYTPAGFVSPTLGIQRESEPIRIVEPARPGEWQRMRQLARGFQDPRFTLLVWLGMDTGARHSEIDQRCWNDVNLDDPEGPHFVLLDTKTDKPRRIYFSHDTAALLRRLRPVEKYRHNLIFLSKRGAGPNKYQKSWTRYAELIGRPELRFHDLRHMVAAELLKAGKGMSQVAQLLGHSSLVLHRRYGHLDDAAVRDIQAERLSLDTERPEWAPVAEAKLRHAEREAAAPADAASEAQRLHLVAQEAIAAAMAAAQALANMRTDTGARAAMNRQETA